MKTREIKVDEIHGFSIILDGDAFWPVQRIMITELLPDLKGGVAWSVTSKASVLSGTAKSAAGAYDLVLAYSRRRAPNACVVEWITRSKDGRDQVVSLLAG